MKIDMNLPKKCKQVFSSDIRFRSKKETTTKIHKNFDSPKTLLQITTRRLRYDIS